MLIKYELKKIIFHPVLWVLTVVFMVLNFGIIGTGFYGISDELQSVHDAIISDAIDKNYLDSATKVYDDLDMEKIKSMHLKLLNYNVRGSYKTFIDHNYKRLNKRVDQIKKEGEAKEVTYPGRVYQLHKKLYHDVFKKLLIEMAVLMGISILFLMDYERINRTEGLIYSSKQGRKIQIKKLFCGILSGYGFIVILMSSTFLFYFSQVSYKGLWDVSVSSAFAMEPRGVLLYPFITYTKFTFGQYFLVSVLYSLMVMFFIGIFVGAIYLFLNNSYLSILTISLLLLSFLVISEFTTATWLDLILSFNFSTMWVHCGSWFMENEVYTSFAAYDWLCLLVQLIVTSSFFFLGKKRFICKDML